MGNLFIHTPECWIKNIHTFWGNDPMQIFTEQQAREVALSRNKASGEVYIACALNEVEWIVTRHYNPHSSYPQHVYNEVI